MRHELPREADGCPGHMSPRLPGPLVMLSGVPTGSSTEGNHMAALTALGLRWFASAEDPNASRRDAVCPSGLSPCATTLEKGKEEQVDSMSRPK